MKLKDYTEQLEALRKDMPQIMETLLIAEGLEVVKQAKRIVTIKKRVNIGQYRSGFHTGDKKSQYKGGNEYDGSGVRKNNGRYEIDVYNPVEHAVYNEYGTRAHWVPGRWQGKVFVYEANAKTGQMMPRMEGIYALTMGERNAMKTQDVRLSRRLEAVTQTYLDGGGIKDVKF